MTRVRAMLGAGPVVVTIVVGLVMFPHHSPSADMIRRARIAQNDYCAESGRSGWVDVEYDSDGTASIYGGCR